GIANHFTTLEDSLAWGDFDAVANVTPDRIHHPTTLQAVSAGKHVFCEKPLATDFAGEHHMPAFLKGWRVAIGEVDH
ncbi:Gfo/Idh/MocA family oxidoreductase, partial [Rhizobium leguminosarum]|uniref:Gfo/Idh/MocA family oxidoreductase n=1 Tax=Rhizobium leguminosarum TaxID=384 RepID=UPI003F9B6A34